MPCCNLTRISAGRQRWGRVQLHIVEERVPVRAASSAAGFCLYRDPPGALSLYLGPDVPHLSSSIYAERGSISCHDDGGIQAIFFIVYVRNKAVPSGKSHGINSTQPSLPYLLSLPASLASNH